MRVQVKGDSMEEFKGKMFHIAHTHYMGKAGSLSWGGGKTKEYLRWERQQTINEEAKIPKEYYYDEGLCELKIKSKRTFLLPSGNYE